MQWRIVLEAVDPTGDGYRREFSFDKDIGRLEEGELGCSIEDGKAIMTEIQRVIVQREIDLYLEFSRICLDCRSRRQIKDRRVRKIETVFGVVEVESPRYRVCQKCSPYTDFSFAPVSQIVPDGATPELIRLTAKLGALLPYRQAADVLATFVPGQSIKRFTTLRNRTLKAGKAIQKADFERWWQEFREEGSRAPQNRPQQELPLSDDGLREVVLSIDTAFIPRTKREGGRTFQAIVCQTSRGGRGEPAGPTFAFSGTNRWKLKAFAAKALSDQGYDGYGDITVLSDGEACLKNLVSDLPGKARHILDWFHIAMKVQPLAQMTATVPDRFEGFCKDITSVKWRLWNGQVDRALKLMRNMLRRLQEDAGDPVCLWARRAEPLLARLFAYIQNNQGSIANYGARHRAGQRIATTSAEGAVGSFVAKRFVKKQQMRWSTEGADRLLAVRTAVLQGELRERMRYDPHRGTQNDEHCVLLAPQPQLPLAA